jgi:hypothetical protein
MENFMINVSYIGDDELGRLHSEKQRRRVKFKKSSEHNKARNVEVDICYIQRELSYRQARRDAHKQWLLERVKHRK